MVKSQNSRWVKGQVEVLKKLFTPILSSSLPFGKKIDLFMFILVDSISLFIFFTGFLGGLLLFFNTYHSPWMLICPVFYVNVVPYFLFTFVIHHYFVEKKSGFFQSFIMFLQKGFLFLFIAVGFSLQNSISVLQALIGIKTTFLKTAKYGKNWGRKRAYHPENKNPMLIGEIAFTLFLTSVLVYAFINNMAGIIPLLILYVVSYVTLFFL